MEKDLVQGNIGNAGKYDLAFKDGMLVLSIEENDALGSSKIERSIGARAVLEALKKAIPGTLDDAFINMVEAALGV